MLEFGTTKGRLRFEVIGNLCALKGEVAKASEDRGYV